MLEISIHAGCLGNTIQARANNGTTWITGSDEYGNAASFFVNEIAAVEIVETLARAFPKSTLKLQLEWLDAMHRNVAANAVPTSDLTERQAV